MSGKLKGFNFKYVVNSMLASELLFPEYKKKVDDMSDEEWYPWDDYTTIVSTIAEKLGPTVTRAVGVKIVEQGKEDFMKHGFDTSGSILSNFYELASAYLKNVPPVDFVHTRSYEPGKAVMEAGMVLPGKLIEGYLTGIVRMYGNTLKKLDYSEVEVDGTPLHRYELEWHSN